MKFVVPPSSSLVPPSYFCGPLIEPLEPRTLLASTHDQISEAIALGRMTTTRLAINESIGSGRDVDVYSFGVADGQTVSFDIDQISRTFDPYLRLFNGNGRQLARSDDDAGPNETPSDESYIKHKFEAGGTYYIGVSGYKNNEYDVITGGGDVSGSEGRYTLALIPLPDPDADDQITQAHSLGAITRASTTDPRAVGATTDVDMFSFTVAAGDRISFDVDRPTGTLDSRLRLFKANGRELAVNDDAAGPGESPSSEAYFDYTFSRAGTYYIGISGGGNGAYDPLTGRGDASSSTGPYTLRVRPLSDPIPLLPDLIAWKSRSRGYLYDYELDTVTKKDKTLLRFTTTSANIGAGPVELRGGDASDDQTQEVFQRIYDNRGGHEDRLAGEFVFHDEHGHIHFDDYARYRLREVTEDGRVGDVVAGGRKTSFALLDSAKYDTSLPGARLGAHYDDAGQVQGISVGWADVYEADLPDQWIDVTDVPRGEYWLEVTIDPRNRLTESDEDNNIARIKIELGRIGDLDDEIGEATALGRVTSSVKAQGYSISTRRDVDMFSFRVTEGQRLAFDIDRPSSTLDSYIRIFDREGNELAANNDGRAPGEGGDDESYLRYTFDDAGTYYIGISGYDNTDYNPRTGRGDVNGSTASYTLRITDV